jgi:hypothetical protein
MNINESLLHQIASRFIKEYEVEVEIKGSDIQLEVLHDLLNTSKNLMTELNRENPNIDDIFEMLHEKKELTRKFQNITGIEWKL